MDARDFSSYLSLYGADLARWPEEMRAKAIEACAGSPSLRALLNEERAFEESLQRRSFEPSGAELAERIVRTAAQRTPAAAVSVWAWLDSVFGEFHVSRPAYAFASFLILGFVVGFGAALDGIDGRETADAAVFQNFLYADEELL